MPDEIKNPFDFGTGSIDKDQWLRDIDEGQELFIGSYGPSLNKHRTALLRLAFADLRRRISNGDMLSRTADGLYQFGSALNRDDKHMLEAYERALGFMGELARRLIKAPTKEPEKKKFEATTLEDAYKKSLFPGKFNEKAYWDRDESKRKQSLIDFLEGYTKEGALDSYQDFGSFESSEKLRARLNSAIDALKSGQEMDYNLGRLGFQGSWITKPVEETETEAKSDLELALERYNAALEQLKVNELNLQTQALNRPAPKREELFTFNPLKLYTFESYESNSDKFVDSLRGVDSKGNSFLKPGSILKKVPLGDGVNFRFTKTTTPTAWNGQAAKDARIYAQRQYNALYHNELNNFFKGLGVNYKSYLNNTDKLKELLINLAKLFTVNSDNAFISPETISRYFVKNQDGTYGLKGTNLSYDLQPNGQGVLYQTQNIDNYKEGGIIKGEDGLVFDDSRYVKLPAVLNKESKEVQTLNPTTKVSDMDTMDWANILGPAILDLTSMGSANVPGYGTAISAGTGIASTLWSGIKDWHDSGAGSGLATIGTGLLADTVGLIPGWGSSAKLGKIAKGLSKYAKYIGPALSAKGMTDAAGVFNKWMTQGGSSLTKDDINTLVYGLVGLTSKGTASVKRANRSNLERAAARLYNVVTKNGKEATLNAEQLAKLRAQHKVRKVTPVVTLDALIEANDEIMQASKWPIFGSVSLNRLQKMMNFKQASELNIRKNTIWKHTAKDGFIETPAYKPSGLNSLDWGVNIEVPITKSQSLEKFKEFKDNYYKRKASKKLYGGILKALRNGGIIKAVKGVKLSSKAGTWYNDVFSGYGDTIISRLKSLLGNERQGAVDWLNGMLDSHSTMYSKAGNNFNDLAYGDATIHAYLVAYNQGNGFTTESGGFNTLGIKPNYNTRYDFEGIDRNTGDNATLQWGPDGYYSQITDDRRLLGRDNDWTPENLEAFNKRLAELGYVMDNNYDDKYYRIKPLTETTHYTDPNHEVLAELASKAKELASKKVEDTSGSRIDPMGVTTKNPFDPTLLSVAAKTLIGLRGNANIYGNLLREMPQAPLRDPIDRKLAILGWQDRIKKGQNELADLRRILQMLLGYDPQTNFAKALETERVGRDISDKSYMEDSGRQFETAGKSWNIDNEDLFYNTKVHDDNVKAILDRARMMAQIRAAWRSGDNNILMGALADTTNWWLKRYQREQDLLDKAKELALGTPEEKAQSDLYENDTKYRDLMDKYLRGDTLTDEEKAYVRSALAKALRGIRGTYALSYYNSFHNPLYGGNFYYGKIPVGKDGTKLEVEKLKARGKDNDRFVSMFKDLRKHSYRRRRR